MVVDVCKCVSDPDAMVMLPVALTSVSAPLIKETMRWQVASLPTLVIGPFLPTPSLSPSLSLFPHKITHLCLFFSFSRPCSLLLSLFLRNVPVGRQGRKTL